MSDVRMLLDSGADPNAADVGYTALHAAVLRGGTRLVNALVAHGANPNLRMTMGTPVRRNSEDFELPATLLGAVSLSPIEVTHAYQTIASGGFRMPLRAIREVTDGDGKRLSRYALSVQQAFAPEAMFLLTQALIDVMRTGTGRSAYQRLPRDLVVAGKTGTTDDLRDSWFAGFDENHLAVVWIGRDDNQPIGLTG